MFSRHCINSLHKLGWKINTHGLLGHENTLPSKFFFYLPLFLRGLSSLLHFQKVESCLHQEVQMHRFVNLSAPSLIWLGEWNLRPQLRFLQPASLYMLRWLSMSLYFNLVPGSLLSHSWNTSSSDSFWNSNSSYFLLLIFTLNYNT